MTAAARPAYVLAPGEAGPRARIGAKAANLAVLGELGLRVPPWFVVTAEAFDAAMRAAGLDAEAARLLDGAGAGRERLAAAAHALGERVRALAPEAALAHDFEAAFVRTFGSADALVAVRSSALGEDSATHAFAGQLESFLFVRGAAEALAALVRCWASGFGERALAYRAHHGLPLADVHVAVIVQAMVPGRVSGVLFTADPVSGSHDRALVSALYGLGDGLVSGALEADHWTLEKRTGAIQARLVAKRARIVFDAARGHGTARVPVPAEWQEAPSLDDATLRALVAAGERVAERQGAAQDLEWTLDDEGLVWLQTRPITTLAPPLAGGRRQWDDSNIAESYPGLSSPLTFSFVRRLYMVAYQVLLRALGVSERWLAREQAIFENLLGYLNGRIYYNLSSYELLNTFFPARDAIRESFSTMIGVKEQKRFGDRRLGLARFFGEHLPQLAWLTAMIGWRFATWDAEVRRFEASFATIHARFAARDYAALPPDEVLAGYRELERDLLWGWRAPMLNDFFAMVFFGALRSLATRWGLEDGGGLVNDLLRAEGHLASTAPAEALGALAARAATEPELARLYAEGTPAEVVEALAAGRFPAYAAAFDDYLARYGARFMGELKLELPNLHDDPAPAHALVARYLAMPEAAARVSPDRGARERAEATALAALAGHPLRRWLFTWVLANARKGVYRREALRMARTQVFGVVRAMFLGLGRHLHSHGALAAADDVFWLDIAELFAFVEGRATTTDLDGVVALRRREHARYAEEAPPHAFETVGVPYLGGQLVPSDRGEAPGGNTLAGIGCCPGRVAAPARVVTDPTTATLHGEILVAERTDPGWVLLYPLASGLLIEHGSLLSHAAVTARELGLPAIIGVKDLTRRVKDGEWLEMDGRTGVVTLGGGDA